MEERIKKNWQETHFNANDNPEQLQSIMEGRRRTALEDLARRYRVFSILCFMMAAISIGWGFSPLFGEMSHIVSLALVAFFLLCGSIDDWFCRGIQSIDVATMSVAEVASKALCYKKRHLQAIAVLAPLAICIVGLMAYALSGDKTLWYGMIAGGMLGLTIGLLQLRRFIDDYRKLSE